MNEISNLVLDYGLKEKPFKKMLVKILLKTFFVIIKTEVKVEFCEDNNAKNSNDATIAFKKLLKNYKENKLNKGETIEVLLKELNEDHINCDYMPKLVYKFWDDI